MLISPFYNEQLRTNLAQQTTPTGASFTSKLKKPKYIAAIVIIAIILVGVGAAAYYYSLPKSSSTYKIVTSTSPRIRYLGFNVQNVTDVRVRQAIAYAVDRSAINSNVFNNLTQPLYSMVPSAMPYSQPVFQTKYGSSPNLLKAESLLKLDTTIQQMAVQIRMRNVSP